MIREVEPEDLIKYGLIPEFIGRLPVVATLEELEINALIKVLTEPKNSVLKQFQALFEMEDVELEFKDEALTAIAELSIKRKTGARGLRTILEKVLLNIMYEIPSLENVEKVIVNTKVVRDQSEPLIIYHAEDDKKSMTTVQ